MHFCVYNSAYNISKGKNLPVLFSSPDHMHFYYETAIVIWSYLSRYSVWLFMESQVKNRWPLNQRVFQQDILNVPILYSQFLYYISQWFGSAQQCLSMAEARDCKYHGSASLCKCPVWGQTPRGHKSTMPGGRAIPSPLAHASMVLICCGSCGFLYFPQVPSIDSLMAV